MFNFLQKFYLVIIVINVLFLLVSIGCDHDVINNNLKEEFNHLLQEKEITQQRKDKIIKSLIKKYDLANVFLLVKNELENKDLDKQKLALDFLRLLPSSSEKTDLLQYLYINKFNGTVRFSVLLMIAELRKRETIPLFINEFDEEIEWQRHLDTLDWCVLDKFLINIFFPSEREWVNTQIKGNDDDFLAKKRKKKVIKEKLIKKWLEDKNFLYWEPGNDIDLHDTQRLLKGYWQVDVEAKQKNIPIDQYNKEPLSPQALFQAKESEKIWQEIVLKRNQNLLLDSLITLFRKKEGEERFDILQEIINRYHNDKNIIPILISSILDATESQDLCRTISEISIDSLEKLVGITINSYEDEEEKKIFKKKCMAFWDENMRYIYWLDEANQFVIDKEAKAAGIPTDEYRKTHPWPKQKMKDDSEKIKENEIPK